MKYYFSEWNSIELSFIYLVKKMLSLILVQVPAFSFLIISVIILVIPIFRTSKSHKEPLICIF